MASMDNFQQVKVKVDQLAQINDILQCFGNAAAINLRFLYNESPEATFRLDGEVTTALKAKYQTIANGLWTEIKALMNEDDDEEEDD